MTFTRSRDLGDSFSLSDGELYHCNHVSRKGDGGSSLLCSHDTLSTLRYDDGWRKQSAWRTVRKGDGHRRHMEGIGCKEGFGKIWWNRVWSKKKVEELLKPCVKTIHQSQPALISRQFLESGRAGVKRDLICLIKSHMLDKEPNLLQKPEERLES